MKHLYIAFFILLTRVFYGQINSPNVLASAGASYSTTTFFNVFTIGEMCVVETATLNSDLITQGFLQPDFTVVELENDITCKIPNGFSPNNDGFNDVWEIPCLTNYPDASIKIFNLWGQEVFTSVGYNTPWNGSFRGQTLPTADYYYLINLNNSTKGLTGTITLKR
jgi:gliding motility-associated-like protein